MLDAKYQPGQRVRHIHTGQWGTVTAAQVDDWRWVYAIAWDQPFTAEDMLSAEPAPDYWRVDHHTTQEMRPAFTSPDERYKAIVTWEGCFHLDLPEGDARNQTRDGGLEDDEMCYHHICDIDTFIARLLACKAAALEALGSFG